MKVKLCPPSVKIELVDNVEIRGLQPVGNEKVSAVIENYVNAIANALSAFGTLSFPRKVAELQQLRKENSWLDDIAGRQNIELEYYKRSAGIPVLVGKVTLMAALDFIERVSFDAPQVSSIGEEVEI